MGRLRNAWQVLRGRALEQQASEVGPVIAAATQGLPRSQGMKASQFAAEGYQANVVAFRCIEEIAKAAATVPMMVYRGDAEVTGDHRLVTLLSRANPMQSWQRLFIDFVSYHRITGNAYMEAVGAEGSPPSELYALRPDRMSIKAGPDGFPARYTYKIGAKTPKHFDVDFVSRRSNIWHWKTFNPLDDYLGMSPIQAAAMSIDQHNQANEWNTRLIGNDARPPGTFKVPPGVTLQEKERTELEAKINEKVAGPQNAGKIRIQAGLEWQPMAFTPHDMDWLNSKHTSARDICGAFGFPPMLLGIPGDNTYSNYKEARMALYEDTVMPLVGEIVGELNNWLTPRFGDGLEIRPDWDEVSALSPRRESRWARINTATFLKINEKREAVGYPEDPDGDVILIPGGSLPLGFDVADLTEPQFRKELEDQGYSEHVAAQMAREAYRETG